jgi:GH15 family glucan-1,4-alpha-glucosidase
VRVGNGAQHQQQLDVYGYLLELAWRWHERGRSPDDEYWQFLSGVVDEVCSRWVEPDRGIWEVRSDPKHFTHSKVMCWAAINRGLQLADGTARSAPHDRWVGTRDQIRDDVLAKGYDAERGVFVRAYRSDRLDAALLLLTAFDFVAYGDERMVRTTDAIMAELDDGGLLRRYREDDGLDCDEGAFVACAFWLVECLARQGRAGQAKTWYDRAMATANDLGLFAEEYDPHGHALLGNFPQGLSHLSHIAAAVALTAATQPAPT